MDFSIKRGRMRDSRLTKTAPALKPSDMEGVVKTLILAVQQFNATHVRLRNSFENGADLRS